MMCYLCFSVEDHNEEKKRNFMTAKPRASQTGKLRVGWWGGRKDTFKEGSGGIVATLTDEECQERQPYNTSTKWLVCTLRECSTVLCPMGKVAYRRGK